MSDEADVDQQHEELFGKRWCWLPAWGDWALYCAEDRMLISTMDSEEHAPWLRDPENLHVWKMACRRKEDDPPPYASVPDTSPLSRTQCVWCGRVAKGTTWIRGDVLIYRTLYACSITCAEMWGKELAREGYKPGQPGWVVEVEPGTAEGEESIGCGDMHQAP